MPRHIRLIGRYGNALVALALSVALIGAIAKGNIGASLTFLIFIALAAFNVYLTEKANQVFSEEEWLQSEIRKAELRRKLITLNGHTPEAVGRRHGL